MNKQELRSLIREEIMKLFYEESRFDMITGYQTTSPEWLKWEDKLETTKEDLYNLSKDFDESLTKFVKLCKTIRQTSNTGIAKMSSNTQQDWYNAMLNVEASIDVARKDRAWSSFVQDPVKGGAAVPISNVQSIASKLEVLEVFLDEMPEKLSSLIKKTGITSETVYQKIKKIESLHDTYQSLLDAQPTHWIK